MAIDRTIPTSPPSNTTMAYFAQQVQEELTPVWRNVVLELTVTNTGNALTATANPTMTSYNDGKYFMLVVPTANTGAMTLNIDGLGARPLVTASNVALSGGEIGAGQAAMVYFDSGVNSFRLIGGGSGSGLPTATQQWQVLQADATLNWVPSQELFSGNF